MKAIFRLSVAILLCTGVIAQDRGRSQNSLFENSEARTYNTGKIMVQGEVQNAGLVDLNTLPLRSTPVKELAIENGKQVFKGAYFVSGYALYDILNSKKIKKAPENTFGPPVDMYAVVENDKGQKAVFSWGEIYYRNSFAILITGSAQAINPVKLKTSWSLPAESRLICANDLLNVRFISAPTKITVRSYHDAMPPEKPKDLYSPEIKITAKTGSAVVRDIKPAVGTRRYESVLYGHGMGFKEVQNVTGYLLKEVISTSIPISPDDMRTAFLVVSAKDGYRSVFSASEIVNRSDNQDLLLNDAKDSKEGRYTLIAVDFFADRDVRGVEKIEIVNAD